MSSAHTGITDPSPYQLARVADVAAPDSDESPGAKWLVRVHGAVDEIVDAVRSLGADHHGAVVEAADNLVPIYTHHLWQVWTDLTLYQEDFDDIDVTGQNDPTRLAEYACYIVAQRLLDELVGDVVEEDDDKDDDKDEDDDDEGAE